MEYAQLCSTKTPAQPALAPLTLQKQHQLRPRHPRVLLQLLMHASSHLLQHNEGWLSMDKKIYCQASANEEHSQVTSYKTRKLFSTFPPKSPPPTVHILVSDSFVSEMHSPVLCRTSSFTANPITFVSCPCYPAARKHVQSSL